MTITDLTRGQLAALKARYYAGILEYAEHRGITDREVRDIDGIIPDEEIMHFYGGADFAPDELAAPAAA